MFFLQETAQKPSMCTGVCLPHFESVSFVGGRRSSDLEIDSKPACYSHMDCILSHRSKNSAFSLVSPFIYDFASTKVTGSLTCASPHSSSANSCGVSSSHRKWELIKLFGGGCVCSIILCLLPDGGRRFPG